MTAREPSGAQWCSRFPGSADIADLTPGFAKHVSDFIHAMQAGGATVTVAATYRPPERAYLMHFACLISGYHGKDGRFFQASPAAVPPMDGVDIDWTHGGNIVAARDAAAQMVTGYAIRYPAALVSRHTQRRAIDMMIRWNGTIRVSDGLHITHSVTRQEDLVPIGKTFDVIKLVSDPPHWSDDGC